MIKPSKAEIAAAVNGFVQDVIAPELDVLFCGINPGLYSAATGFHFARPGNRFWPTLHRSGFTPRLFLPSEELELISLGCGITNIASRATNTAAAVSTEELQQGAQLLTRKVLVFRPRVLAILGISAYRTAFGQPKAVLGRQPEQIGETIVWVLPNPSGLNAHFPPTKLAAVFREFREELIKSGVVEG
ncbi:G/U mismatch-specific DNA glycosylase [Pontibacter sp. Tf4]|uniref:G/U mismatch-specific DNA glycosylase n=1 Tax=Pontibacter sp. Tf4 TaxID=2761620 RepID=UPI001629003F|nr:G/U mismatch-specific DNA glycosylase [Pontibacter sp. Tf4]MBB6610688.1 G/U mismatch-specific DNA glycosylase [Pontibacter sp. Tf4]